VSPVRTHFWANPIDARGEFYQCQRGQTEAPSDWIRWLAVRSSARGIGIGQCLVEEAVKRLATSNAISVDTFREENTEGRPARRLYERLGFLPGPLVQIEGLPRQRYTLSRLHKSDFCNG
jgi:GNAT superfamily N-acetyltransferase